MKRYLLLAATIVGTLHVQAQNQAISRPKLVVGLMIDQMRWDYLYRYYDKYTENGFKRLMREGYNCQNTMINYLPSFTAPGHTCVYTGSVPSIHGIAANDWIDAETGEACYCTEDAKVKSVGGSQSFGQMSPENLMVSTITDELRLATNMRSKVFGIALKDRSSILPAGHIANGAYWFDDTTGNLISSSYYGDKLPGWLIQFNSKRYVDSVINKDWTLLYPSNSYANSLDDNSPYEGRFRGESAPVFPHSVKGINRGYYGLRFLPGANNFILKAAKACIRGEQLGQRAATDFLCVSLSTPDYSGHTFGPNSVEMEDMYLRVDKELAGFLAYLDGHVGEGNYTIFLTADHGAAHNPQYMKDVHIPAGNQSEQGQMKGLNVAMKQLWGKDSLIKDLTNYQVYLNEKLIKTAGLRRKEVKASIIEWMNKRVEVAYAVDMEDMSGSTVPEPLRTMIINGYNAKRSGCIQLILQPGWYSSPILTGTTHGTWNPYDTHIPLLFYGWGIKKGATYRSVNMTDITPTIAALLHIQMPNGCIGSVITEALAK